ncbi:MAG: 5-formyltetrahydrofolate cyclo-ligase [Proteocatella sp.]
MYNENEVLMDIIKEKKELRNKIKKIKSAMSGDEVEESDKLIEENLMNQKEINEAQTIFCFVSMKDEINTKCIIKKLLDRGKKVGVPKCKKDNTMEVYQIESLDDLEIGFYSIEEPKGYCKKIESQDIDLALIPATACDKKRNRIGKGAGYYDRYLENQKFLKIALCRQKFIVERIPVEENDINMDKIVTEKNIY